MKRVIIESPYAGDVKRNLSYARMCVLDCLKRGESPYASHLFFTQVLDDKDDLQRKLGIVAGLEWGKAAKLTVVYEDYGISMGMEYGIANAEQAQRPIEYRKLWPDKKP